MPDYALCSRSTTQQSCCAFQTANISEVHRWFQQYICKEGPYVLSEEVVYLLIMRSICAGKHQTFAVLIVLFSFFLNSAKSSPSKRFILTASPRPSYAGSTSNYMTSSQRIVGFRMRSSTSQQSTPIGGGAYQEVSQRELLNGVVDKPVDLKRPEKLNNKYYGLRHGKTGEYLCLQR